MNLKLMLVNEDGESEGEYDLTGCDLSKSFRQAEVIDWLRAAMEAAAYRAKQRQEES